MINLNGAWLEDAINTVRADEFNGTLLIAHNGRQRVECFGYANRDAAQSSGVDVQYDIGSLTKQFTATAILLLQMSKKLSVDDTLADHFSSMPEDKAAISLHQLLTHTAGFVHGLGDDYTPVSRDELVALAASAALVHEPGARFSYSNVGYSLLAAIIETTSGLTYERFLRDKVFGPSGMAKTGYVLHDTSTSPIAVGYRNNQPLGRPDEQPWTDDGPYWHLHGNGGLLSTANDMLRWHEALRGDTVLDSKSKEQLYASHVAEGSSAQSYYGYGWTVSSSPFGTALVRHSGGNGIFFADFWRFIEENLVIYIATNSVQRHNRDIAERLAQAIIQDSRHAATDIRPQHLLIDAIKNNNLQQLQQAVSDEAYQHHDVLREALYQSVLLNRIELAQELIKLGVKIESITIDELSLFEFALRKNRTDYFDMLLDCSIAMKSPIHEDSKVLPLLIATCSDDPQITYRANALLDLGANVNAQNRDNETALILAGWLTSNIELVQCLVARGADIDVANINGDTALIDAAYLGKNNILEFLLDRGADRQLKNKAGHCALDMARHTRNAEAIGLLER